MSKIEFGALHIAGFKAYVQPQVLDFAHYPVGVHFIRGINKRVRRITSNGAAKSTIFDAASWCLFGRTVEGLRNPDVVPWSDPHATTDVSWEINVDDSPFTISRTANPNLLTINDSKVSQEEIERLIGLTPEVFNHAILLGQDQKLFFDLLPSEKMKVFSEVLQLERWLEHSKKASTQVSEIERRQSELEGLLTGTRAMITNLNTLVEDGKRRSDTWEKEKSTRRDLWEQNIERLEKELVDKQRRRDDADLAYDSASTEAKALEGTLDAIEVELADLIRKEQKAQSAHNQNLRDIERLKAELSALGDSDTCPTCGQSVKGTDLDRHKQEISRKITTLRGQPTRKRLDAICAQLSQKQTAWQQASDHRSEFLSRAETAEHELHHHAPVVAELETKIQSLKEQLADDREERNPYREQVSSLRQQIQGLATTQKKQENEFAVLAEKRIRTHFWVNGFKEVRLFKIQEVLEELQLVSNTILSDIGLDGWGLSYAIEKETKSGTIQRNINVMIQSPDSPHPVRWECYSGSERQRLRLIGALSLSEVLLGHAGVVSSLIALDEPTKNLSDESVEDLCTFLSDRAKEQGLRVFLIDHMSKPSRFFMSTITVEKSEDGTSTILT